MTGTIKFDVELERHQARLERAALIPTAISKSRKCGEGWASRADAKRDAARAASRRPTSSQGG